MYEFINKLIILKNNLKLKNICNVLSKCYTFLKKKSKHKCLHKILIIDIKLYLLLVSY